MKKVIVVGVFVTITLAFLVLGGTVFLLSVRSIKTIQTIEKYPNVKNAIITAITSRTTSLEETVYFKAGNNIYRTHLITMFSKDIPKTGEYILVKSDMDEKFWLIEKYVNETYRTYIFRIILSVSFLVASVFFCRGTLELYRKM